MIKSWYGVSSITRSNIAGVIVLSNIGFDSQASTYLVGGMNGQGTAHWV